MTGPLAFRGTYADWRLIKTRGVVQVVMEVPLADADAAYQILGGMPDSSKERWFGIAPLTYPGAALAEPATVAADLDSGNARTNRRLESSDRGQVQKREKMDWRKLQPATQAGIRCEDPVFKAFVDEMHSLAEWNGFTTAEAVRAFCGVKSRSELSTNHKARVLWHQLDSQFQAWKAAEHA